MERSLVTTAGVRRLLDRVLPTDSDLRAFLLDELGSEAYQRVEGHQDRKALVTHVLLRMNDDLPRLVAALERWAPAEFERHRRALEPSAPPTGAGKRSPTPSPRTSPGHILGIAWLVLLLIIAALLLALLFVKRDVASPQIIVVQTSDPEALNKLVAMRRLQFDTPDQFAAKVEKVGPGKVRYQVAADHDEVTQELLRLVVALLIQNNERISATKYPSSQVRVWQRSGTKKKFLIELAIQIEATLEADRAPRPDLGMLGVLAVPDLSRGLETQAPIVLAPPPQAPAVVQPEAKTAMRVQAPATDSEAGEGYLIANTHPLAKVIIDGRDTGKSTPIGPRDQIPLPPGWHKVTFVTSEKRVEVSVVIVAAHMTKVVHDLNTGAEPETFFPEIRDPFKNAQLPDGGAGKARSPKGSLPTGLRDPFHKGK